MAQEVTRKILDGVTKTLAELPPEVAGDVYERGLILTGGGSLFGGLDDYLREATKRSVSIADEPRYSIVRGLAQLFHEPHWFLHLNQNQSPSLLDVESPAL